MRLGLHMANNLLTVLLLRVSVCKPSVGWRFCEDMAGWSSYNKTRIMPYYNCLVRAVMSCVGAVDDVMSCHVWVFAVLIWCPPIQSAVLVYCRVH